MEYFIHGWMLCQQTSWEVQLGHTLAYLDEFLNNMVSAWRSREVYGICWWRQYPKLTQETLVWIDYICCNLCHRPCSVV